MNKGILTISILFTYFLTNGQNEKNRTIGLFYSNNISLNKNPQSSTYKSYFAYGYSFGGNFKTELISKLDITSGINFTTHKLNFKDSYETQEYLINEEGISKTNFLSVPIGLEYKPNSSILLSFGISPTYLYKGSIEYEKTLIPGNNSKEFSNTNNNPFEVDYLFMGYFVSVGYIFEINSNFDLPLMLEYNLHAIKSSKIIRDNDFLSSLGLKIEIRYKWKSKNRNTSA
jgi:hypothetical protein